MKRWHKTVQCNCGYMPGGRCHAGHTASKRSPVHLLRKQQLASVHRCLKENSMESASRKRKPLACSAEPGLPFLLNQSLAGLPRLLDFFQRPPRGSDNHAKNMCTLKFEDKQQQRSRHNSGGTRKQGAPADAVQVASGTGIGGAGSWMVSCCSPSGAGSAAWLAISEPGRMGGAVAAATAFAWRRPPRLQRLMQSAARRRALQRAY